MKTKEFHFKKWLNLVLVLMWATGMSMIFFLFFPNNNITKAVYGVVSKLQNSKSVSEGKENSAFANNENNSKLSGSGQSLLLDKSNSSQGAYIFVEINKKHFLTRFASFYPDEETIVSENSKSKPISADSEKNTKQVTIIQRRSSAGSKNKNTKPEDFSIKPVPTQ